MKFYKVVVESPDEDTKKEFDNYSKTKGYGKRPGGKGPSKKIIVTNRKPEEGEVLGRWSSPGVTI